MDKFRIHGGVPLEGEIAISGAKNSALPALAACLLTSEPVKLQRIPPVRDIGTMQQLLQHAGAEVVVSDGDCDRARGETGSSRGALRFGQDHAGFQSGAGAAGGSHGPGACVHARRLRHRGAAHQPACGGARTAGR